MSERWAVFGGVYSNHVALAALLEDAARRGAGRLVCLGDIGAFGPYPDLSCELLRDSGALVIQGNYDDSVGRGLPDCQCGYTDPRDNHFARLSYAYTLARTSETHRAWMRTLPPMQRLEVNGRHVLMVHGSPRRQNEFLWESATPDGFLVHLLDAWRAGVLLCTHTGLHWGRRLPGGRCVINVGAIGRPANDGRTCVWYAMVDFSGPETRWEFIPLDYDWPRLVHGMRADGLPEEFVQTIETGWWTTCLEILPIRERMAGRY
ncbi:MAG: hypothetical protein GMKNLPBB_00663 [Myxococcota bacterium]|nr:hypothetical protein [Myxococcota bacterium]